MGKHKKIKAVDPFYYGNRKQLLNRNEKVVNQAPKNCDDQEVPRKLRELMQWKQHGGKAGKPRKTTGVQTQGVKRQKGKNKEKEASTEEFPVQRVGPDEPEDGRPVEKVPAFTQKPWESEKRFVERMHWATQVACEKAKWAPDIDPLEEERKKKQKAKGKQHVNKKKEKLKAKRREQAEDQEEQRRFTDHVRFGEVVSQPPDLTARPRKSAANDTPGKKSLLLNTLLNPSSGAKRTTFSTVSSKPSRKRKDMSAAERRILDAERERAIQAYRTAKKAKLGGTFVPPVKKIIIGDL